MSDTSTASAALPLDPTGVPGLDEILGGGVHRGSLVIVAGPPGSGKTTLAHHIAFETARSGKHVTILTAYSEPTNKLLAHMATFRFFDQSLLGRTVEVLSIQQFLKQGLDAAISEVVGVARAAQSNLVVLDGFRGVRESTERPEVVRRFVYDVSNRLSVLGMTLLLTSEAHVRDSAFFPEATTADILLGLAFDIVETRERRTLEVLKARGATPLAGRHALTVGERGITLYPRLESRVVRDQWLRQPLPELSQGGGASGDSGGGDVFPAREDLDETGRLVTTGFPALDALLDGGLWPGANLLVTGAPGTGKTVLSLQFALAGTRAGEPVVFVSFRATAAQLVRQARTFAWGAEFEAALQSGALRLLCVSPADLHADILAEQMLGLVAATGARRLIVDEVGEFERALFSYGYPRRFHDFLAALLDVLYQRRVTTLLTRAEPYFRRADLIHALGSSAQLAQVILWLRASAHRASAPSRSCVLLKTGSARSAFARQTITFSSAEGMVIAAGQDMATLHPPAGSTASSETRDEGGPE